MICPYCAVEMEKGVIESPHMLIWSKEPSRSPIRRSRRALPAGSAVLSEESFFAPSRVPAWRCGTCRKIIIDPTDGAGL